MKKRYIFILLVITTAVVAGQWNYTPHPTPAKDILSLLDPIPLNIIPDYGRAERTRVIYNVVWVKARCQMLEARIATLEEKVRELEAAGTKTIPPEGKKK